MTIIYPQELSDNLGQAIKNNNAIAMTAPVARRDDFTSQDTKKAKAAIGEGANFDIYHLSAVLASVGTNANDDVFTAEELWAARATPIYKQFNYGHNEKDIIGCIYDSFLTNASGQVIDSEDQILNIKDICTYAVIWTRWEDEKLQARINKAIADIEAGNLYVSMEVLFKNFDYLLTSGSETKIVKRTAESAFLTKYLRSFGGTGIYEDYKIERILRDYTFSGKGLVENPANKRSVIDPDINIISKGSNNETNQKGTYNMSIELLEKQIATLTQELSAVKAANIELQEAHAAEKQNLVTAEIDSLKSTIAEMTAQSESLKTLAESRKTEIDNAKAEAKTDLELIKAELAKANDVIATMESEKVVAGRVAQLVEAGNTVAKAQEICKTWASSSDEQFAQLVTLYTVNAEEAEAAMDDTDNDGDCASAGEDFTETVEKTKANLNIGGDTDKAGELYTSIAKELTNAFTFTKKN